MIEEEESERTALLSDRNCRVVNVRPSDNGAVGSYKTYKRRWIVLFVLFLTSLSNAVVINLNLLCLSKVIICLFFFKIWISYSPIADKAATFYNVSAKSINWFALIYLIVCIPFGFCAAWLLDTRGLRITVSYMFFSNITSAVS